MKKETLDIIEGLRSGEIKGDVSTPNHALRERNAKVMKKALYENEDIRSFRTSFSKKFGFDPMDSKKLPVTEAGFSWKKLQAKLEEADASSSFTQFLRAGIQQITLGMYQATDTTYEDWVTTVQSNKDTELYAPNHGVSFPRQVGPSSKYPEVGVAALDMQLKNFKFGNIYALERELLDDDQTGSFQRQAGLMGQYMKLLHEVWVYGKLNSVSGGSKYIDLTVPVSETKPSSESNYPWSTSLVGGGANKGTAAVLSQANVQNGIIGLMKQLNLQGIKMLVRPSRLLISPKYSFDAAVLIHSAYYPSGAAAAGSVGGAFAINPLKSILDITVSRFIFDNNGAVPGDSKAWYIVDDSVPWFVLQLRTPIEVVQEAPNSGEGFERDIYRFKGTTRFNADFIDPRFAWQGSDGSA